jgi:hypothetical protein
MRIRPIAAFGSAALVLAVWPSIAATASTASPSATLRTEYRAELQAQLRYNSSGRIINDHQISYDDGNVVVTVATPGGGAPDYNCPDGRVCIFELDDLRGSHASINEPEGKLINARGYLPVIKSLHNKRTAGVLLQKKRAKRGHACYPAGSYALAIAKPVNKFPYLYLQRHDNC